MLLVALGLAAAAPMASAQAQPPTISAAAGQGQRVIVQRSPFRLWLADRHGREVVGTLPAGQGPPLRPPGLDGPQPVEPLGPEGAFPAFGFVVGGSGGLSNPLPPFTGNRLFGAEAGVVVSIDSVATASLTPRGMHLTLNTDLPSSGPATLDLSRLSHGGVRLTVKPPAGLSVSSTIVTLSSPNDEGLYGLGTRRDAFDQRGLLRNVWVEEQYFGDQQTEPVTGQDPTGTTGPAFTAPNGAQMAFFAQAALSGSRGWTAWVRQSELQRLDLANSRAGAVRWAVAADHVVLSLAGGGLERSVQAYTADAGRAPPPPRYVFEPWLDRINQNGEGEAAPNGGGFSGGPATRADLQAAVEKIHALHLPISTLGVEGWQAVPGGQAFFPWLRSQRFNLVAYWNPFLAPGNPVTNQAIAEGVVVKNANGQPYPVVTNRGNYSYVVDFTNPKAQGFWNQQLARSCALGFEGTHADFGEYVIEGMNFYDGTPPAVEHNRYPIQYARATRIALQACNRRNPFFYVRAGFSPVADLPGSLSYTPAVIVGDESTDWSRGGGIASLPAAMLNLAIGGGSTFISDVGGYFDLYTPPTTAELFTRWSQLSALTPVMRIHDDTIHGSLYPWNFDAATLDAYRRYARLKVRLVGLVEHWSKLAARDGLIGPVRPLLLDDPSPAARTVGDEWLLGHGLLVAPVIVEGARARRVYLPAGARWERVTVSESGALVPTGRPEPGGQTLTAPAPLADIPLFVRVLPRSRRTGCTGAELHDTLATPLCSANRRKRHRRHG